MENKNGPNLSALRVYSNFLKILCKIWLVYYYWFLWMLQVSNQDYRNLIKKKVEIEEDLKRKRQIETRREEYTP